MEKHRLARQTSLRCLLAAAALLSAVVVGPAQAASQHAAQHVTAAAARHPGHRHARPRRHRPAASAQRRAAPARRKAAAPVRHRPVTGRRGAALPAQPALSASPVLSAPPALPASPVLPKLPALPTMRVMSAAGFDTCWAPPTSSMQAWHDTSDYRAVGIYIGGRNRACVGGNLSPTWVSSVSAQGWGLIPVYVGLQAPCVSQKGVSVMRPAQAAQEGADEADDAAAQAAAYGLAKGSPVYFDLEAFRVSDQGCVTTVLDYLDSWTRRLHAHGYYAGVYGSAASGIVTLARAVRTRPSFAAPDAIWIARWDLKATTADGSVPDGLWHARRIKQYRGGHKESHGGAAINVDADYLDGPVARVAGTR